jgi:hypothetical protein
MSVVMIPSPKSQLLNADNALYQGRSKPGKLKKSEPH